MRPLLLLSLVAPAVAQAGFRVSSYASTRGSTEFAAQSALDSDPATAWMTAPEADNVGSWFEVDVPQAELDKIALRIGWERDDETFTDYARVRTLKIEVFDQAASDPMAPVLEHSVSFEDRKGWQVVDVPDTAFGNELFGGRIRLTVVETYEGRDYPNLAVGEILLHLKEKDAPVSLDEPPGSAHDDHFPGDMVDGDPRTFWSAGPNGTGDRFTVSANGWGVSSIGILPGPATHRRPKTLEIEANDVTRRVEMPEHVREMQWFPVPPLTGFTGSGFGEVEVRVIDTWPGSRVDELAIAEVKLRATYYDGL